MKTYRIEYLPEDNIVMSKAFAEWGFDEMQPFVAEMLDLLDGINEDVVYIADLRDWNFSVDDVINVATFASRESNALLKHPHIVEFVVVSEALLIRMAAKGLKSDAFGNIPASHFESIDEAMQHARSLLVSA